MLRAVCYPVYRHKISALAVFLIVLVASIALPRQELDTTYRYTARASLLLSQPAYQTQAPGSNLMPGLLEAPTYAKLFNDVVDFARKLVAPESSGQEKKRVHYWTALGLLRGGCGAYDKLRDDLLKLLASERGKTKKELKRHFATIVRDYERSSILKNVPTQASPSSFSRRSCIDRQRSRSQRHQRRRCEPHVFHRYLARYSRGAACPLRDESALDHQEDQTPLPWPFLGE